jgi:hypothetical protein
MIIDPECDKNVFQIWREQGEKFPFKVIRWTWSPGRTFLVERIEIGKWPYGHMGTASLEWDCRPA